MGAVSVKGWREVLGKKKFSFMVINDGTSQGNLQIILDNDIDNYEDISSCLTGACVEINGELVKSQGKGSLMK